MINSICVYCGSRTGTRPEYENAAVALGRRIAESGRTLVYGGGDVGLMGFCAEAALNAGGQVIGIIPQSLMAKEVALLEVTEMKVVSSMHERKALMEMKSDAFIALPGGFGTLDEFFEIVTWRQLEFHAKPIGILNIAGYFDPLIEFMDRSVREGFVQPEHRNMIIIEESPEAMLKHLSAAT
jgi:uncharacterized protein (TIGR00730 family)